MKTNELRLGNLIKDQFNDIITVDGIDDMDVFSSDCGEIPIHVMHPIELTEDWLLKFGFRVVTESDIHRGWAFGDSPITYDYLLYLVWMKNEDGTLAKCFYQNGCFIIRYVHELQNLYFALARKELELLKHNENEQ